MPVSIPLKTGEYLFKHAYKIYKPLYFFYKTINEKNEIKLLKSHIHSGMTVLDIGANIGYYTQLFSELVGNNGKVFAFEPDENNFEKLKKNTQRFKNIIIENKAVSHQSGKIKLYKSRLNVDHRTYPSDNFSEYEEIDCISIDEYFSDLNLKVDFIKMDIQGFEPAAFLGMSDTIQKNTHLKLFSEFWPYGLKQAGYSKEYYYQLLRDKFNKIFILENSHIKELKPKDLNSLPVSENKYFNILAQND